jgi:hypothetical protein
LLRHAVDVVSLTRARVDFRAPVASGWRSRQGEGWQPPWGGGPARGVLALGSPQGRRQPHVVDERLRRLPSHFACAAIHMDSPNKTREGESLWQHCPHLASAWEGLRVGVALRAGVPAPGLGRGPSVRRVHTEVI